MRSKPLFFGTLTGIALVVVVLSVVSLRTFFTPEASGTSIAYTRGQTGIDGASGGGTLSDRPQMPDGMTMSVGELVEPSLSQPIRDMPAITQNDLLLNREINPRQNATAFLAGGVTLEEGGPDPLAANGVGGDPVAELGGVNFNGVSYEQGGSGFPPDPTGDVGPNHYFQSVNSAFQIYNKSGGAVSGIIDNSVIWSSNGGSGACASNNDGDPIVLYDQQVDRWLFTQFVAQPGQYALCVAVSQSGDPLGAYYRYQFNVPGGLPDYPKYGIWPDAYYISANEETYTAYALNRAAMLAGQTAGSIKFTGETNLLMPADWDGAATPPAGSPGLFYTFKDGSYHGGGPDRLEVFEFRPNFTTPANSTFTRVATIPVSEFTYTVCGFFNLACVPQPGTDIKVDAVSEWPMTRLVYRNMGTYQALVGNFTVDVGGDRAGIRWFELRKPGATWVLHQEGTYSSPSEHRWMGSIAMDKRGNIGLGYSVTSNSMHPSLGYTTRLASDPVGQMRAQSILHQGTASQILYSGGNPIERWGDYSALSVDPVDDCTFWYTGQYYDTSVNTWKTRIGTFEIPGCSETPQPQGKLVLSMLLRRTGGTGPTPTRTPTQPGPTVTPTPTQPSGGTIVNGTFEQGAGVGWVENSSNGYDIVVINTSDSPTLPTHSGSWLAWLGGADNEISSISQTVTVPGSIPYLAYWIYIGSQETEGCAFDKAFVTVNGTVLREYGLCQANNTGGYVRQSVNLSAYSGQTVTIAFEVETDGSVNSNFFVDDVSFATSLTEDATLVPITNENWKR